MTGTAIAPEPKIAVASWSFHEEFEDPIIDPRFTVEKFMGICAGKELEIPAVELLYAHLIDPDGAPEHPLPRRVQEIRTCAENLKVKIACVAIDNDFVNPSATERNRDIEYVARCLDTAHELGAGLVRINAGISRCSSDVIPLLVESVKKLMDHCPYLTAKGEDHIRLVLENQGGITQDAYNLMDIMLRAENQLGSDVLGICLDTGNFVADDCVKAIKLLARGSAPGDPSKSASETTSIQEKKAYIAQRRHTYELLMNRQSDAGQTVRLPELDEAALDRSFIWHVHAKSYTIDPTVKSAASVQEKYTHIFWQLFLSCFDGYYSIEYEGQEGYPRDDAFELEKPEEGSRESAPPTTQTPPHDQRRLNTIDAVRKLRRLVLDTYNEYRRHAEPIER
jgi:hypothetical protein